MVALPGMVPRVIRSFPGRGKLLPTIHDVSDEALFDLPEHLKDKLPCPFSEMHLKINVNLMAHSHMISTCHPVILIEDIG